MSENKGAKTLSEAIAQLEQVGKTKSAEIKNLLGSDFSELKKSFEDLMPYLDTLKTKVESEVSRSKSEIEDKITKNPWLTFAIVGFVAFVIGCFVSAKKKDDSP